MTGEQSRPPGVLRIVAALFVLGAALAVLRMVLALTQGQLNVDVAILGFWMAPGLLRGNRAWRRWAILLAAIQVVSIALVTPFVMGGFGTVTVDLPGVPLVDAPRWMWLLTTCTGGAIAAWQWWVLTRPAIRAHFSAAPEAADQTSAFPA
jgi:hypothetical protein